MFETKEQVIKALSQLPKGAARRQLLDETNAVNFISAIGSNVTLYCGKPTEGNDFQTQFAPVNVILIQRRRQNGEPDGIGALGGLSECIDAHTFEALSADEKLKCIHKWDNVILENGQPVLTTNVQQISLNNVKREVREELGNIGIHSVQFPWKNIVRLPFNPQDDSFLVNRWELGERVNVVFPQCCALEISSELADYLITKSNQGIREKNTELFGLQKYALTDVLFRDGDSSIKDYQYPHEWLSSWFIGAQLIKGQKVRQQLVETLKQEPLFTQHCQQMRLKPELVLKSMQYNFPINLRQKHSNTRE